MQERLMVLMVWVVGPGLADLLGGGEGQGSCAAHPFRARKVQWNRGCPDWASCCSEYGYCRPREEWDKGEFRDCNGVSNGTPLPYHVMKYEAQLYPYVGKPAGLIGPPPLKPSYGANKPDKPSYKPSKSKQKKPEKFKKHKKSKKKNHGGHHKMPTSFLEAPKSSNHREGFEPTQFISDDSGDVVSDEYFDFSNLPRLILTFLTERLSEIRET